MRLVMRGLPSDPVQTTVLLLPEPQPFTAEGTEGAALLVYRIDYDDPSDSIHLEFLGQPGVTYHIERSSDRKTWTKIGEADAGLTGAFVFVDDEAMDLAADLQYYRASRPPQS
jgi:hypothetical protein